MRDVWQRYFPVAYLGPLTDVAEWAGQALGRLGESPLHSASPHQPFVVRLLCLPTWSPACSVRVETSGLSWRLVGRELNGEAGFDLGELDRREDRSLSAAESEWVADLWPYLRFWSLPPAGRGEDVLDGTSFVMEAVEHGRYHAVSMDDPEWGQTFGEFSLLLLRLAGFLSQGQGHD